MQTIKPNKQPNTKHKCVGKQINVQTINRGETTQHKNTAKHKCVGKQNVQTINTINGGGATNNPTQKHN